MARQIKVGIDIGTHHIKTVVSEETRQTSPQSLHPRIVPKVIGTGISESKGIHHGYIMNATEARDSIRASVAEAEHASGAEVKRAYVSVGGIALSGVTSSGSTMTSRADLEVTELDLAKAAEAAEAAIPHGIILNKKIINSVPLEYKADGKAVWGQPLGLKAQKLEVKMLFLLCQDQHLQSLIKAVEGAGVEVIDVVAAPVAASFVCLSKKEKKAGSVLANIGAETLSIVVYENDTPISVEVFPIGGTDITNDIALGLKVSLEEAESIKRGAVTNASFSKKKLDDIINARLSDCFELIEGHLRKIGRNALLPAGIFITGGSALLNNVEELAGTSLKLPAKVAEIRFGDVDQKENRSKDPAWSVAYGLAAYGFIAADERGGIGPSSIDVFTAKGKSFWQKLKGLSSQFLP